MIDEALHIIGFASNIKARDVREFSGGICQPSGSKPEGCKSFNPLRYGVFRYGAGDGGIDRFEKVFDRLTPTEAQPVQNSGEDIKEEDFYDLIVVNRHSSVSTRSAPPSCR